MERRIRRPPGSLPGAAVATVVGAVVIAAFFPYLFRGVSVWSTVDGPVQRVRSGDHYDYRAVVEYRPREDVAHLCGANGICRTIVEVPRDAAVGDEIRIRHLVNDPLEARSISWSAFGVPGEQLIPFVLAVLAVLIALPLSIWHLRFRRNPSATAEPATAEERASDAWDRAAGELGLEIHERPRFFGLKGHLAGTVDGFNVTVRKEHRGEGTVTGIRIEFPSLIGPPGLQVRFRKHFGDRGGGRRPRGWAAFTGSEEKRAVLAKADDPNELAAWMTPTRIEGLINLPVRYRDVVVTREAVWTHRAGATGGIGGRASSKSIVEEVQRIIPFAQQLI